MNQAAFFQSRDDLDFPARGSAYPVEEGATVAGIAQRAGRNHTHFVARVRLCSTMKAPEHVQGMRHGLRVERAAGKDAFAQPRDLAIFVEGFEPSAHSPGDF